MHDFLSQLELSQDEATAINEFLVKRFEIDTSDQTWIEMLNRWLGIWQRTPQNAALDGMSVYSYVEDLFIRGYMDELLASIPESARSKLMTIIAPLDEAFFVASKRVSPILPGASRTGDWIRYIPLNPGEDLKRHLISEFSHNRVISQGATYEDLLRYHQD